MYIAGLPTKQVELAREIAPMARRVGLLTNMNDPKGPPQVGDLRAACQTLSLDVVEADTSTVKDIPGALDALAIEKVDVVGYREHVIHGGLVSYGVDLRWCYRRAGYFVDKILRGTRPGDLPIEFPTGLWLAANLKTAQALGVTVPAGLLARADEVIE